MLAGPAVRLEPPRPPGRADTVRRGLRGRPSKPPDPPIAPAGRPGRPDARGAAPASPGPPWTLRDAFEGVRRRRVPADDLTPPRAAGPGPRTHAGRGSARPAIPARDRHTFEPGGALRRPEDRRARRHHHPAPDGPRPLPPRPAGRGPGASALKVAVAPLTLSDPTGRTFATNGRISEIAGVGLRTVGTALGRLAAVGRIRCVYGRGSMRRRLFIELALPALRPVGGGEPGGGRGCTGLRRRVRRRAANLGPASRARGLNPQKILT